MECREFYTQQHGVALQETWIFSNIAVWTPDLSGKKLPYNRLGIYNVDVV
jgi:hypothetical protein